VYELASAVHEAREVLPCGRMRHCGGHLEQPKLRSKHADTQRYFRAVTWGKRFGRYPCPTVEGALSREWGRGLESSAENCDSGRGL
jgi:hypothetical protein